PDVSFSGDGRQVMLAFHVTEGVRYRLVEVPRPLGIKTVPAEQLEGSRVKPGEFYKQADVDADVERIKDHFGYQGRDVSVIVTPTIDPEDPGVIRVQYEVVEAEPARIGRLIIGEERPKRPDACSIKMAKQAAAARGAFLFW